MYISIQHKSDFSIVDAYSELKGLQKIVLTKSPTEHYIRFFDLPLEIAKTIQADSNFQTFEDSEIEPPAPPKIDFFAAAMTPGYLKVVGHDNAIIRSFAPMVAALTTQYGDNPNVVVQIAQLWNQMLGALPDSKTLTAPEISQLQEHLPGLIQDDGTIKV